MDFHLSEDLVAAKELAREILTDASSLDQVVAVEKSATRVDDALWGVLTESGLVTLQLPEAAGGAGLGLAGLAVVLIEQGRVVAPVPLWSAAIGGYAVARLGTPAQAADALADGSRVTLALEEFATESTAPRCAAVEDGDGWVLTGVKACVPTPAGASHVVVSATTMSGPALFLVGADAPGLVWEQAETTSRDWAGNLHLSQARAAYLGGAEAVTWILQASAVALAALQVGVAEGALALTADYLKGREQFGRSLGSFQAVHHQLADCWINLEAMRVTLWQAVTTFDAADAAAAAAETAGNAVEATDLARVVDVARYWCGQGGADLVHRTQHLHGGIGVDVDYPIHRYYLWGKQTANTLGGPMAALAGLGDLLGREEIRS